MRMFALILCNFKWLFRRSWGLGRNRDGPKAVEVLARHYISFSFCSNIKIVQGIPDCWDVMGFWIIIFALHVSMLLSTVFENSIGFCLIVN